MEIKKRDYIWLLLICLIWVLGSCMVQDSRAMVPPGPTILEKSKSIIQNKIRTAEYIVWDEAVANAIALETAEEAPAEKCVEIDIQEEVVVNPLLEELAEPFDDEEPFVVVEEENIPEPGLIFIGTYEVTAYEYTGSTCANGNYPTPYYTVACNSLPFGTELYLDGVGWVVVEDRGADWHSDYWLDLYIGDVEACYEWGVQYRGVYLVN